MWQWNLHRPSCTTASSRWWRERWGRTMRSVTSLPLLQLTIDNLTKYCIHTCQLIDNTVPIRKSLPYSPAPPWFSMYWAMLEKMPMEKTRVQHTQNGPAIFALFIFPICIRHFERSLPCAHVPCLLHPHQTAWLSYSKIQSKFWLILIFSLSSLLPLPQFLIPLS